MRRGVGGRSWEHVGAIYMILVLRGDGGKSRNQKFCLSCKC